jgi:hypothetical protein
VSYTATDPQNDALTYSVTGAPAWITVTTTGGIKLVVAPGPDVVTTASKSFDLVLSVSDGNSSTNQAVTVTVANMNQKPTVAITSPNTVDTVIAGSNIVIDATASDNDGTISKVDFYLDNTVLSSDNASPFTSTLTNIGYGTHSIMAAAIDDQGDTTRSTACTIRAAKWNVYKKNCKSNGFYHYSFGPNGNPIVAEMDTFSHQVVVQRFNLSSGVWQTVTTRSYSTAEWGRIGTVVSICCAMPLDNLPVLLVHHKQSTGTSEDRFIFFVEKPNSAGEWSNICDTVDTIIQGRSFQPQLKISTNNQITFAYNASAPRYTLAGLVFTQSGSSWVPHATPTENPLNIDYDKTKLYALSSSYGYGYTVYAHTLSGTTWTPVGGADGSVTTATFFDNLSCSSTGVPYASTRNSNTIFSCASIWKKIWPLNSTADSASSDFRIKVVNDQVYAALVRQDQATSKYNIYCKRLVGNDLEGVFSDDGLILTTDSYSYTLHYSFTNLKEHLFTWYGKDSNDYTDFRIAWTVMPE